MPSRIQALKQRAFHIQEGRCCYCQAPMWLRSPADLPFPSPSVRAAQRLRCTAEHLTARSAGGANSSGNIAAACHHCNQSRHRRKSPPEPQQYRELVAARISKRRWHPAWVGFPRRPD
jgi:5-methylcytosine-specific restriction endonuclease McrA